MTQFIMLRLENTKEYAEMHYYNIKHSQDYMLRTKANRFWVDYAKHPFS